MEEKVNSVIKSWTFFSKELSFIGRILYGKVVIGLKVIYYINVNRMAVWV